MNETGIAAIIGATGGFVISFLVNFLVQRRRDRKQSDISMKDNYQTLYLEMRREITRIQTEQSEERRQWAEERKALYKKIDDQTVLIHSKDIETVELKGKVAVLEEQIKNYETRNLVTPTKQVTIKT